MRSATHRATISSILALGVALSPPAAAEPKGRGAAPRLTYLERRAAPEPLVRAALAEPDLAGLDLLGFTVQREDLDGDGRPEQIVLATTADQAGLRPLNRPAWIFTGEGAELRRLVYLGAQLRVEASAARPGERHRGLRVFTKDGPAVRCHVMAFAEGEYRLAGRCP